MQVADILSLEGSITNRADLDHRDSSPPMSIAISTRAATSFVKTTGQRFTVDGSTFTVAG